MENKEFRAQRVAEYNRVHAVVTDNFEALCTIAKEITEPTRIETPFGQFTFTPYKTFASSKKD